MSTTAGSRIVLADGLVLAGSVMFLLDLALALAAQVGWIRASGLWLGILALAAAGVAFLALWVGKYRGVGPSSSSAGGSDGAPDVPSS